MDKLYIQVTAHLMLSPGIGKGVQGVLESLLELAIENSN